MNMGSKGKVAVYVAAILAACFVAGGAVGYTVGRRSSLRPPPPNKLAAHIQGRLKAELGLTDEQIGKVAPLVEESATQIRELHRATFERILEAERQVNRRIEEFLTPDQRARLRELEQRREEQFRRAAKCPKNSRREGDKH